MMYNIAKKIWHALGIVYNVDTDTVPCPFVQKVDKVDKGDIKVDTKKVDTKFVTWGSKDRPRRQARVQMDMDTVVYELDEDVRPVMAMPVHLTWADIAVMKKYSIKEKDYVMVRPGVLAGATNKEIAQAIGMSKSWVERRASKVKEAVRMYQQTPTIDIDYVEVHDEKPREVVIYADRVAAVALRGGRQAAVLIGQATWITAVLAGKLMYHACVGMVYAMRGLVDVLGQVYMDSRQARARGRVQVDVHLDTDMDTDVDVNVYIKNTTQ